MDSMNAVRTEREEKLKLWLRIVFLVENCFLELSVSGFCDKINLGFIGEDLCKRIDYKEDLR